MSHLNIFVCFIIFSTKFFVNAEFAVNFGLAPDLRFQVLSSAIIQLTTDRVNGDEILETRITLFETLSNNQDSRLTALERAEDFQDSSLTFLNGNISELQTQNEAQKQTIEEQALQIKELNVTTITQRGMINELQSNVSEQMMAINSLSTTVESLIAQLNILNANLSVNQQEVEQIQHCLVQSISEKVIIYAHRFRKKSNCPTSDRYSGRETAV